MFIFTFMLLRFIIDMSTMNVKRIRTIYSAVIHSCRGILLVNVIQIKNHDMRYLDPL